MSQLVILANGQCTLLRWWFWTFYAYAPVKIEYAINRFALETKRLLDVLDQHLAKHEYLAGSEYSIADIAAFPWYGGLVKTGCITARSFRCRSI